MEHDYDLPHLQQYVDVMEFRVKDSTSVIHHTLEDCHLSLTDYEKQDIMTTVELLRKCLDVLESRQLASVGARVLVGNGKFIKVNLSR